MSNAAVSSANAVRTAAANAGSLEQRNQQNAAAGQPEQSGTDVWRHTRDGMRDRMQNGLTPGNPYRSLADSVMGPWNSSSPSDVGEGLSQQFDAVSSDFMNMIGLGDPKKNPEGVLQNVGAFFGVLTGIEQLLTMAFGMIPFPAFPAIRVMDLALGLPHGHPHPPTFGTPLPSLGPILPIPFVSGANTVLINGMPAGRCGDMGIGAWCGGYVPIFEVFLGSANVWVEGARAGRMICDVTNHCIFSKRPGPKDPPVGPFIGTMILGSPNVMVGGVPLPSLVAMAMGAAFKAMFKGLGKGFQAVRRRLGKGKGRPPSQAAHCVDGHPVLPVTGDTVDEYVDYVWNAGVEITWRRYYYSSWNRQDSPHGWGYRHEYQRELHFNGRAWVYVNPERHIVEFPTREPGPVGVTTDGMRLRRVSPKVLEIEEPGQPTMEFEVAPGTRRGVLRALRRGPARVELQYDGTGRLQRLVSPSEYLKVQYDDRGHIRALHLRQQSTGKEQVVATYQYDASGALTTWTDALGHSERYSFDEDQRLIQYTTRCNYSFWYTYDAHGRCVHTWGDDGLYDVTLDYRPEQRMTVATYASGMVRSYRYNADGVITELIDGHGGVTTFVVDGAGRVVQDIDPAGNVTTWLYDAWDGHTGRRDPWGRILAPLHKDPYPKNPLSYELPRTPVEWEYGGLLPVRTTEPLTTDDPFLGRFSAGVANAIARVFDKSGKPTNGQPTAHPSSRDVASQTDELSRIVMTKYADGTREDWVRDPEGKVLEYRDRDGSRFQYRYQSWRKLTESISPVGGVCKYEYSGREHLSKLIDANGNVSEYGYDAKDRLVEVRRHGRLKERYHYDAADNVIAKTDGNGRTLVRWEIGSGNRATARHLASGESHYFEYDERGQFSAVATDTFRVECPEDFFGRRLADKRDGLGVEHAMDGARHASTTYLDRFTVHYHRRPDRTLVVTDPTGREHALATHPHGLIVRTVGSGTREIIRYDEQGRCLQKMRLGRDDTVRGDCHYDYSAAGDLRHVRDSEFGTTSYEYDAAHRLRLEITPGGRQRRYVFDLADNLHEQPGLAGARLDSGNRLVAANGDTLEYNERNALSRRFGRSGETIYQYDALDSLVACTISGEPWRAEYDPFCRRVRKTWRGQTTEYYWDGFRLAAEMDGNRRVRIYLYSDLDALVPFMFVDYDSLDAEADQGRPYFIFTNQIGCPVLVEDVAGNVCWRASIDPFGMAHIDPRSTIELSLRFPNHYFDAETGLHYNRFRYYNPELGRYLESDPWGVRGGVNLYAYCPNPLVHVDLDGLTSCGKGKSPDGPNPTKANEVADPGDIRFTQDTVSPNFSDGGTLTDVVNQLRRGEISPKDFPTIRVVEHNGKLYSLDNRRLAAFQLAGVDDIPIQRVSMSDPAIKAEFRKKFRPINDGKNIVVVPSKGRAEARRVLREHGKYKSS